MTDPEQVLFSVPKKAQATETIELHEHQPPNQHEFVVPKMAESVKQTDAEIPHESSAPPHENLEEDYAYDYDAEDMDRGLS